MYNDKEIAVIIAAAGRGRRMGAPVPKQFIKMGGEPILAKTLRVFEDIDEIDHVIIVTGDDYIDQCNAIAKNYGMHKVKSVVEGGTERQDSVYNALKEVNNRFPKAELVLIHDAARPFVPEETVANVIRVAYTKGAAVACVPMKDSLRKVAKSAEGEGDGVAEAAGGHQSDTSGGSMAVDRSEYFAVQTPQGFRTGELLHAYEEAMAEGWYGTNC